MTATIVNDEACVSPISVMQGQRDRCKIAAVDSIHCHTTIFRARLERARSYMHA